MVVPAAQVGAPAPAEDHADVRVGLQLEVGPQVADHRPAVERAARLLDVAQEAPPQAHPVDQLELDAGRLVGLLVDPDLAAGLVERVVDAAPDREATANVAYGALRCVVDRLPLLRCSEALGQHSRCCHHAGLFVPATSPVATVIAGHLTTASSRGHQRSC